MDIIPWDQEIRNDYFNDLEQEHCLDDDGQDLEEIFCNEGGWNDGRTAEL